MSALAQLKTGWFVVVALFSLSGTVLLATLSNSHWGSPLANQSPLMGMTFPAIGDHVKLPNKDSFGKSLPKTGPVFLVTVGECSTCAVNRLESRDFPTKNKIPIVFLLTSPSRLIPEELSVVRKFNVIFDAEKHFAPHEMYFLSPYVIVLDSNLKVSIADSTGIHVGRFVRDHQT